MPEKLLRELDRMEREERAITKRRMNEMGRIRGYDDRMEALKRRRQYERAHRREMAEARREFLYKADIPDE